MGGEYCYLRKGGKWPDTPSPMDSDPRALRLWAHRCRMTLSEPQLEVHILGDEERSVVQEERYARAIGRKTEDCDMACVSGRVGAAVVRDGRGLQGSRGTVSSRHRPGIPHGVC